MLFIVTMVTEFTKNINPVSVNITCKEKNLSTIDNSVDMYQYTV